MSKAMSEYRRWIKEQEAQGLMAPGEANYELKRMACCCAIHGSPTCPDCPEHGSGPVAFHYEVPS
jgi:hypothetical protein